MMKERLTAACLFATLACAAQDVGTYAPQAQGEGVVYYLPKTEIELQVTVTRVDYVPGELCQYANRYLRLNDVPAEADVHWELTGVKVRSVGVPDPDNAYVVKLKDKGAALQVELTDQGIIRAINTAAPAPDAPAAAPAAAPARKLDPRAFLTEEMLQAGSRTKMAELAAREIYNIRESKYSLTRGQADYMPKDGAALKLMLESLEEQEQALTQLFAGTTERAGKTVTFRFNPEESLKDTVAFRMSRRLGLLSADNLAGEPCYLTVVPREAAADPQAAGEKKKPAGIIYNIPGKGQVSVRTAEKRWFDGELPVTQFGVTETLLFNKKVNTRVVFHPDTGAIVKIDKD